MLVKLLIYKIVMDKNGVKGVGVGRISVETWEGVRSVLVCFYVKMDIFSIFT